MDPVSIPLSGGQFALVDAADAERVRPYRWHVSANGYARAHVQVDGRKRLVSLHRFLLDAPAGSVVDHRDRDKLNNTRANLRLCDHARNVYNTASRAGSSAYKGVYFVARVNRWKAQLQKDGAYLFQGYFDQERDAALAYDAFAREHFGEFAYLNFPEEVITTAEALARSRKRTSRSSVCGTVAPGP